MKPFITLTSAFLHLHLLHVTTALINPDRWTTCDPSQLTPNTIVPWTAQTQFDHLTSRTSPRLVTGKVTSGVLAANDTDGSRREISTVIQLDVPPCAPPNSICALAFFGSEVADNPYLGSLQADVYGKAETTDPDRNFYGVAANPGALHDVYYGRWQVVRQGWATYTEAGAVGASFPCQAGTTVYAEILGVGDDWLLWEMNSQAGPRLVWVGAEQT
jgi:hypothetical protein